MLDFIIRLFSPTVAPGPSEPVAPSKRLTEIELVRAALARHQRRVGDMDRAWREAQAPCCPSCAFGSAYTDATQKVERVEAWLKLLESRAQRKNPQSASMP